MKKTFWVEQKHIDAGIRYSSSSCPIAQCLHENGYPKAIVDIDSVDLFGVSKEPGYDPELDVDRFCWLDLEEEAVNFIANFDSEDIEYYTRRVPEPFSFELEVD